MPFIALAVFFSGAFGIHHKAQAQKSGSDQSEKIISFSSNLELRSDAGMKLTETIIYDFGTLQRHGILRTLRTEKADDKKMTIKVMSVVDEAGVPYEFTTSSGANDTTIKIGSATTTITGKHTYVITYDISNVATYLTDKDEFTWNVVGTGWSIPVMTASASVQFPIQFVNGGGTAEQLTYDCYRGAYGSTTTCKNKTLTTAPNGSLGNAQFSEENLLPGQDLTISVGIPKGIVTPAKERFDFFRLAWIMPLIIFMRLVRSMFRKRRDLKIGRTIIPEYEAPKKITPALAGSVVDGRVDNRDITAGLISVAEQGFLSINRIEKKWLLGSTDYELTVLKPIVSLSDPLEQKILTYFTESKSVGTPVLLSTIDKPAFAAKVASLKNTIQKEMVTRGFFSKNPTNRKIGYTVLQPKT